MTSLDSIGAALPGIPGAATAGQPTVIESVGVTAWERRRVFFLIACASGAPCVWLVSRFGPSALIGVAPLLAVIAWAALHAEVPHLEYDGHDLWLCPGRNQRRHVATRGEGKVTRCELLVPRSSALNPQRRRNLQLWSGTKGAQPVRLDENAWGAPQLERIRTQLGLPMTEIGEVTPRDLMELFPRPELRLSLRQQIIAVAMTLAIVAAVFAYELLIVN